MKATDHIREVITTISHHVDSDTSIATYEMRDMYNTLSDVVTELESTKIANPGMDLRTYLAGQAMQGLYTGISSSPEMYEAMQEGAKSNGYPNPASYIAWQSVLMADALIVELNKEQK